MMIIQKPWRVYAVQSLSGYDVIVKWIDFIAILDTA